MARIAILHYSSPPIIGGVESVIAHHARLLIQAGHSVRMVAARGVEPCEKATFCHIPLVGSQHETILAIKKQLDDGIVPDDFDAVASEIFSQLSVGFENTDVIMAHNVASLHKNLPLTAALRKFCAQPNSPNLILWHHDFAWCSARYQDELHTGYPWGLIREDWPDAQPIHVVVSQLRQEEFTDLYQLPADRAQIIPSGLDLVDLLSLEEHTAHSINSLNLTSGDPIFLLPVRITRRKNIQLAIQIIAELQAYFSKPTLIVTGPPGPHNQDNHNYLKELITLRDELSLNPTTSQSGCVHLMAENFSDPLPIRHVHDLFRIADALIFPSFEEGFGIPMLEAGLVGIPIFASNIAPLKAIGTHYANWFSPYGNPADIAQQISEKLHNDAVFALKKQVRRDFIWEGVFEKHISPLLGV
ncbi:MAG: glycosyltransferase family 4 protein [Chloroflexota bacterium]